MINADLVKTK